MFQNNKTAAVGIVGLGRFGMALAKRLSELGKEVLVIDENESKLRELREYTDFAFVVGDLSKEALRETGIQNCEVAIICIGEKIDVSILATLNVVSLGVPRVIAKAISSEHGCVLEKIGAEVVYPERDMALRLANRIVTRNVLDYLTLNSDMEISEVQIPDRLVGKTIDEAETRKKYGVNIIAIEQGSGILTEIDPERHFEEDDVLVIIGSKKNVQQFGTE